MILEKETYEKFGYYPSDLKRKSSKKILAVCDDCGKIRKIRKDSYHDFCRPCSQKGETHPLFGKHHSEKTKQKMRDAHKGNTNRLDKHHSEEAKKKISDATIGEKNPNFGKHHSKETRKKMREARKHQILPKHHTKPELIFEEICKDNDLPFRYTGNGSFWIGKKPAINPDFVECNGKKIAVEIFSYWHDPLRRHCKVPYSQTYEGRSKILKKYGWKLVVFWQEDLERKDTEQFVLNEMQKQGVM